jgi:hypothetical protein
VISVILYGRNDAHGYNLHRRVALSLNCLAEVLTDPDDEIVFVDYNSPDELPTLVEALADTLTDRCLGLLRVLRVPAAIHTQRFAADTHLSAIEPVARNAGVRRANPSNRWLLSTNTDMVLLPRSDRSLSEICRDLGDGFYGLPRFELPEWLWEHLPRNDPRSAMAEVGRLGPGLRLDEPTVSYDWIRFDAPGDFQLILREEFEAIDGFDEAMLLGWHVDSNLSRRMFLRRGSIDSLESHVAAYHCNHNRTLTVYHRDRSEWIANDIDRFFFSVSRADLPDQRETWGLAGTTLEEIQVRERLGPNLADTVLAAIGDRPAFPGPFDSRDEKFGLEYDSSHVLPFIADSLTVSPHDATVGYIGTNRVLEQTLDALVEGLGLGDLSAVAELAKVTSVDELDRTTDVFVIDLGIDASLLDASLAAASGDDYAQSRAGLMHAFDAFRRVVALERTRLEQGAHPRRFVLVNSSAVFWNAYVSAELHCGATTPHARVRHAIVKVVPDDSDEAMAAGMRALRLFRWIARHDEGQRRLHVRLGETVDFADLDDYGGFGEGWAFPDKRAVWTRGRRSALSIALDEPCAGGFLLTLAFDEIGVRSDDPLRVDVLANDERIATRNFSRIATLENHRRPLDGVRDASRRTLQKPASALRYLGIPGTEAAIDVVRRLVVGPAGVPGSTWNVVLPAHVTADGSVDLTLVIAGPASWSDEKRRGLHLRSITVRRNDRERPVSVVDGSRKKLRLVRSAKGTTGTPPIVHSAGHVSAARNDVPHSRNP